MTRDAFEELLEQVAEAPPVDLDRAADADELPPGTIVDGKFEVLSVLGSGGMGVVYLARDRALRREVALKVMDLAQWGADRRAGMEVVFKREARATARLQHPNVVTLHEFGVWNGRMYLVLERLRGKTLADTVARQPLGVAEALAVLRQIACALEHAHGLGIIHRDLKPHNVFITDAGTVKVLDFGLAGLVRDEPGLLASAQEEVTISAGTPAYMAPEQWTGDEHDARTDLWAAGMVILQAVTGKLPHPARALEDLHRISVGPEVPEPIASIVRKLVVFDANGRLPSASALLAAIDAVSGRKPRRHVVLAAAAALAIAAVAISLLLLGGDRAAGPPELAGTWAYAPEGRAGVLLTRLAATRYRFEYSDAPPGASPSREHFKIRGELTLERVGGRFVLRGEVEDLPGWGREQVGYLSFDVLDEDRLMMTRSDWGKTRDNYHFSYPPYLMVRVGR